MRHPLTLLAAVVMVCASAVMAAPIPFDDNDIAALQRSYLRDDPELAANRGTPAIIARARIGDSDGPAAHELDLHRESEKPFVRDQYAWRGGKVVSFAFTWDRESGLVTFTVDGRTISHTLEEDALPAVFVRSLALDEGARVTVTELQVNGRPVERDVNAQGPDALRILWLRGPSLEDGVMLTGRCMLDWQGEKMPDESRLSFEIHLGHERHVRAADFATGQDNPMKLGGSTSGSTIPGGGGFNLWGTGHGDGDGGGATYNDFGEGGDGPIFHDTGDGGDPAPPPPPGETPPNSPSPNAAPAPEPGTILLLLAGGSGLAVGWRRMNRRSR